MTPELNRALLPLRAPRTMTLQTVRLTHYAYLPWVMLAAAIDGYIDAFWAVLTPPGGGQDGV